MKSAIETAVEEAVEAAVEAAVGEREMEIAKIMLADNETNEKIAKYTGLTIEQIEALRGEQS